MCELTCYRMSELICYRMSELICYCMKESEFIISLKMKRQNAERSMLADECMKLLETFEHVFGEMF